MVLWNSMNQQQRKNVQSNSSLFRISNNRTSSLIFGQTSSSDNSTILPSLSGLTKHSGESPEKLELERAVE